MPREESWSLPGPDAAVRPMTSGSDFNNVLKAGKCSILELYSKKDWEPLNSVWIREKTTESDVKLT
jgi:hypothetical protein